MAMFTYGYTGSMMQQLAPWYDFVPFDGNLWDCEKGGILLRVTEGNPCAHTCIVSVAGSMVLEASDDFDGIPGDSSGREVAEIPIHQNAWEYFGIPKKDVLPDAAIDAGIEWGRAYAADNANGYSQGAERLNPFGRGTDCSAFVLMIVGVMDDYANSSGDYVPPTPGEAQEIIGNLPEWQGEMIGTIDTTNSGDDYAGVYGRPMLMLAANVKKYQAHILGGGWLTVVTAYDTSDSENGCAGDLKPIDAIRIYDDDVWYQTRNLNGLWNEPMHGLYDTGGTGDDFAGEIGRAQDAIRIWRSNGNQPRYNVFC